MPNLPPAPEGTVRVKRDGPRGWHFIAKEKYDKNPDVYHLLDEGEDTGTTISDVAPGEGSTPDTSNLGTDSGDQFSDELLRAIIEKETGKKPHHFTSRPKLIEMFNELNAKASETGPAS